MFTKSRLAWTLPWDADWVTAVAFLGPTRRLAAGNNLGGILVWDIPEKDGPAPPPILALEGHANCVSRLRSSADGRWLWSSSYDKTIRVWDMQAAPKGKATVDLNERARGRKGGKPPAPLKADVATLAPAAVLAGHKDWVTCFDLSADGKTLVSGDDSGTAIVWDAATRKEVRRWALKGWAYAAALSPDAKRVAIPERVPLIFDSGRRDGGKVWDVATGKELADLGPAFKGMHLSAAGWTPDGKTLLLGRGGECDGTSGIVHLADPSTGKKTGELPKPGHLSGMTDMAWHPDGKHLATVGRDTVVMVWDVAAKKKVAELGKGRGGQFKDWLHALAFTADGKWLAAGDMAGAVQVWAL